MTVTDSRDSHGASDDGKHDPLFMKEEEKKPIIHPVLMLAMLVSMLAIVIITALVRTHMIPV